MAAHEDWHALSESLTPAQLALRFKSSEHDFVERKSKSSKRDWLQAAVAFANSAPIGWPAVLFVGVSDDGKPQCQLSELEHLTRSVSDVLEQAFPAIYRYVIPVEIIGEGSCLAVIVPGSPERPHFAGKSYVRVGDATKTASEYQFGELIAQRNSKARVISEWTGKPITWFVRVHTPAVTGYVDLPDNDEVTVVACNSHYCTICFTAQAQGRNSTESFPLNQLEIGFDHTQNRLAIYRYRDR